MKLVKASRIVLVFGLSIIFLSSFTILYPSTTKAEGPIVLRMSPSTTGPPPARGMTVVYADLMKELEKRTNGRIKIDIYWGQSLAKARDLVTATSTGICDISKVSPHFEPGKLPLSNVAYHGVGSHVFPRAMAFWDLLKKEPLSSEYSQYGLIPIGIAFVTDTSLLSKEPMRSIADIKGKKISSFGMAGETINMLGGVPIMMSPPEQYDGLKKGIIDGLTAPCSAINDFKFYEGGKYYFTLPLAGEVCPIVIRKKAWEKLPADIQKIITDSAYDLIKMAYKELADEDLLAVTNLKENNVEFIEPSSADMATLRKSQAELADKWAESLEKKGMPAKKLLADLRILTEKYEKENPFK